MDVHGGIWHWDSREVGICEKNIMSSYGSESTVDWWSRKSCATMNRAKASPNSRDHHKERFSAPGAGLQALPREKILRISLCRLDYGRRNNGDCFRQFPGSASQRWRIYPLMWRDRLKASVMQEQKLLVENGAGNPNPHHLRRSRP